MQDFTVVFGNPAETVVIRADSVAHIAESDTAVFLKSVDGDKKNSDMVVAIVPMVNVLYMTAGNTVHFPSGKSAAGKEL